MLSSRIPSIALISDASNKPHHDDGNISLVYVPTTCILLVQRRMYAPCLPSSLRSPEGRRLRHSMKAKRWLEERPSLLICLKGPKRQNIGHAGILYSEPQL